MSRRQQRTADPARDANERILADRQHRLDQKQAEEALASDLGLDIKEPEATSNAETATEFLADEWDRKTFGDALPTFSRVVYGPDPLLTNCPAMKATIERIGLEAYAEATADAILTKGANALPDPIMRKGLHGALAKFGPEVVADAFRQRIMKIPQRTVEVEAERNDAMIYAQPMEEAVMRYGTPGMAPKFLSERCIGVLGLRGYVIVKDEKGDPVKVGTLIMGEIPLRMAESRRRHYAAESEENLRSMEESYADTASRAIHAGGKGGVAVLGRGEHFRSNAAGDLDTEERTSSYLDRDIATGINFERQV